MLYITMFDRQMDRSADLTQQYHHQPPSFHHLTVGVVETMASYFHRTMGRMQECYQVVFPGQAPIKKKGHIEPIDISVASRGSNKKVTAHKLL